MWERVKHWNTRVGWWADRLVLLVGPPWLIWIFYTTPVGESRSLAESWMVTAGTLGSASRVFSREQYPTLAAVIEILFLVNGITLMAGLWLHAPR